MEPLDCFRSVGPAGAVTNKSAELDTVPLPDKFDIDDVDALRSIGSEPVDAEESFRGEFRDWSSRSFSSRRAMSSGFASASECDVAF